MEPIEQTLARYRIMCKTLKDKGLTGDLFQHIRLKGISLQKELENKTAAAKTTS